MIACFRCCGSGVVRVDDTKSMWEPCNKCNGTGKTAIQDAFHASWIVVASYKTNLISYRTPDGFSNTARLLYWDRKNFVFTTTWAGERESNPHHAISHIHHLEPGIPILQSLATKNFEKITRRILKLYNEEHLETMRVEHAEGHVNDFRDTHGVCQYCTTDRVTQEQMTVMPTVPRKEA